MPADKKLGLGIQLPTPKASSTKAQEALRAKIHEDVERFLANGGVITVVEPGVGTLNEVVEKIEAAIDSHGKVSSRGRMRHRSKIYAIYDMDAYFGAQQ